MLFFDNDESTINHQRVCVLMTRRELINCYLRLYKYIHIKKNIYINK